MIDFQSVNYISVAVIGIFIMAVGALWYSPLLFGKRWMELIGLSEKDIQKSKDKGMSKTYLIAFIASIITAFVLDLFVGSLRVSSFFNGMMIGFWLWLGIAIPILLGAVLWDNKPIGLLWINASHSFVSLVLASGILAVW